MHAGGLCLASIQIQRPRTDLQADSRADPRDPLTDPAQSAAPGVRRADHDRRSAATVLAHAARSPPAPDAALPPGSAPRSVPSPVRDGLSVPHTTTPCAFAAVIGVRMRITPVSRHPASAVTSASPVWGVADLRICTASPACISARHRRAGTNRRTRSPRPGSRRESRRSAAWSCPSSAAMTIRLHGGVLYRQLRQTPARRAGVAGRRRSRALNCGQKENPAA